MDESPFASKADSKDQLATQNVLKDEGTGKDISGNFLYLIDNGGEYHYFQDWHSVAKWAQTKADEV